MDNSKGFTLPKSERLYMKKDIEELFSGKNESFSVFPIRVVFMKVPKDENIPPVRILISVSKRKFKRAVKRNKVKRQIRESYRKNKQILINHLIDSNNNIVIGFIWIANELKETCTVEKSIYDILNTLKDRL